MIKTIWFIISLFLVSAAVGGNLENQNSMLLLEDADSDTTYYVTGNAPVVLYRKDIAEFNINEIEFEIIIPNSKRIGVDSVYRFVINFNKIGEFESFSLFYKMFDHWYEEFSCFVQKNNCYSTSGSVGAYNFFYGNRDVVMNYIISPNSEYSKCNLPDKFSLMPFVGENGYVYFNQVEETLKGNWIVYSKSEPYLEQNYAYDGSYSYRECHIIKRKSESDSLNVELFEFKDIVSPESLYSKIIINQGSQEENDMQYYLYRKKCNNLYDYEGVYMYTDEFRKDSVLEYCMIDLNERECYLDSIYNSRRWLGFYDNAYHLLYSPEDINETDVVNSTFQNNNSLIIKDKDVFINGQNWKAFLLDAYNNKDVLVYWQYYDEQNNLIPSKYKKQKENYEFKILPNNIIIQISLTDFLFVQAIK